MLLLLMLSGHGLAMEENKWDSSSQRWSRQEGWTEDGWSSGDWKSNEWKSTGWTDYADPEEVRQRGSACKSRRRPRSRTTTSDGEWEMPSIDRLVIDDPWRAEASSSPVRGEEGVEARQGGDTKSMVSTMAPTGSGSSSTTTDIADMSSIAKQSAKATKKQRQRENKKNAAAMASVPEVQQSDTDEVVGMPVDTRKLTMQMEVAKLMSSAAWTPPMVDGTSAATVANMPAPPPPAWTPEEEQYVKSAKKKELAEADESKTDKPKASAPPNEDGEELEAKYMCAECKEPQYQSMFLLSSSDNTFKDSSFMGRFYGFCMEHSGCSYRASFRKAVKEAWVARKRSLGERWEKTRDIVYKHSKSVIMLRMPNLSSTQARKMAIVRMEMLVVCLGASFLAAEEPVRQAMSVATLQYLDDVRDCAGDETLVRSLDRQSYVESTWLTEVVVGLWISWTCRVIECRWFGANHMWMKRLGREKYRCPACGAEYVPFRMSDTLHKCQKALAVLIICRKYVLSSFVLTISYTFALFRSGARPPGCAHRSAACGRTVRRTLGLPRWFGSAPRPSTSRRARSLARGCSERRWTSARCCRECRCQRHGSSSSSSRRCWTAWTRARTRSRRTSTSREGTTATI